MTMVSPEFNKWDTITKSFVIHSLFMYPEGLGGTDFFDDVYFDIDLNGNVKFRKVVPYETPEG